MNEIVLNRPKDIQVEFEKLALNLFYGGDAQSDDIRSGKTAYVNGELITGTIPTDETSTLYITDTYTTVPTGGKYFKNDIIIDCNFDTTAIEETLLQGYTAVSGNQIIEGTMPAATEFVYNFSDTTNTIPSAGKYYPNNITVLFPPQKTGWEEFNRYISNPSSELDLESISLQYYNQTGTRELNLKKYFYYGSNATELKLFPVYEYATGYRYYIFGANCFDSSALTRIFVNRGGTLNQWGEYCFANCAQLTEATSVSPFTGQPLNTVPAIPAYCFDSCTALTTVNLSAFTNGSTVGTYAFANCTNLQNVTLSRFNYNSTYIFNKCLGIKRVTFKDNFTSIGSYLFGTGSTATSPQSYKVVIESTTPPTITSTTFGSLTSTANRMQPEIYVPDSAYNTYITATNWAGVHNKWGLHKISELEN